MITFIDNELYNNEELYNNYLSNKTAFREFTVTLSGPGFYDSFNYIEPKFNSTLIKGIYAGKKIKERKELEEHTWIENMNIQSQSQKNEEPNKTIIDDKVDDDDI